MEGQDNNNQIEGGQSIVTIFTNSTTKKLCCKKKFTHADDYQREKIFYLENTQKIKNKQRDYFLKLLELDDDNHELVFEKINHYLSAECSRNKGITCLKQIMTYFDQTVSAIKILHEINVSHCDIKADNILINDKGDQRNIVIIDFGHCQQANQMSQKCCGTLNYNPPDFNISIEKLKQNIIQQIELYNPQELDVYQLGMLLLTMATYLHISDNCKIVAKNQKEQLFKTWIERLYLQAYQKQLQWDRQLFNLIYQILSFQIKDINQIQNHELYQSYLQFKFDKEQVPEYEDMQQIFKEEGSNRGEGENTSLKVFKAYSNYQKLMEGYAQNFEQLKESQDKFFNQYPRKIERNELIGGSVLVEMSTQDLLKALLSILAENNNEIFDQNIFSNKDSLTLQVELIYQTVEITLKDNFEKILEDDDVDDEDLDKITQSEKVDKKIKMSIEIVSVCEQGNENLRSLIFQHINGETIYYFNLVQQIKEKICEF